MDTIVEYFRCPHCNKTIAFSYECDEGIMVRFFKIKPTDSKNRPHLLISRKCDRHECKKVFWVEIHCAKS